MPSGPITLFIQLPGSTSFEGMDFTGARVYNIKDAIIAKFKLNATPQQVLLFKLDGSGSRTPLDPTYTLADAGLVADTRLAVEVKVAAPAGALVWIASLVIA